MNLCIISQYFLPDINGDVIRLLNIIDILRRNGYNITIISAFPHYPDGNIPKKYKNKILFFESWKNVKIIRVPILPLAHGTNLERVLLYSCFMVTAVLSIPFIDSPDLVWAFSQRVFSSFTGLLFKIVFRGKLLTDMTDIWPQAIINTGNISENSIFIKIIQRLLKVVIFYSDKITTLTKNMQKMLVEGSGVLSNKIFLLPNIVDVKLFIPKIVQKPLKYQKKFILMYSGNLGLNYDFNTLLKAASKMKDHSDIHFIIRGYGTKSREIEKQIKRSQLTNVTLETLLLNQNELVNYLNIADAFILSMKKSPYPDASFSIKLLDYISCGRPVLCTGDGYLHEFINRQKIGIAHFAEDYNSLVKSILLLKNDEDLRSQMSAKSRSIAEQLFSKAALEQQTLNIFRDNQN